MAAIREHYRRRLQASRKVQKLLHLGVANDYAVFALGISPEGLANYSAAERRPSGGPLNHRIRAETADSGIIRLAGELFECPDAQAMIECIYHENFPWLKISVGSEMAMMLRLKLFCVCNVRTMWAYMLVDKFEFSKANEELRLYHEQQSDDDDRESQRPVRDSQPNGV